MPSFTVNTPALAAAALTISTTGSSLGNARSAASSASTSSGSFGGEAIAASFMEMCTRAAQAMDALETTVQSLSRNVAAASVGYLVTDHGIVPTKQIPGFKA
jgi:hypothetical protein